MDKLTVGYLKKILNDLPDEMLVGVTDHFGDFMEFTIEPEVRRKLYTPFKRKKIGKALVFESIDIGPEPD